MLQEVKHYIMYFFVLFQTAILFNITTLAQNKNSATNFPEPVFKHLTTEDGLSQNYPLAITQDSRGFQWFGTLNGLNKYDGYSFTVYTHNPYDSTTISGNSIAVIFEDSRGLLWIVTYRDGEINLMDTRTEIFRKIPTSFPFIFCIAEDKDSNIWIGTLYDGLFMIRHEDIVGSNFRFTHYEHNPDLPGSLSNNRVRSIAADNDNNIWIATDSGLDKLSIGNKKDFEHFSFADTSPAYKSFPGVQIILNNNDSSMWLFTSTKLILFNRFSGRYTSYPRKTDTYGYINAAAEDLDGNLWMSDHGRLVVFNIHNKTYDYLYKNPDFHIRGGVASICADKAGNIWMGTNAYGIYTYFSESKRFKTFPYENFLPQKDESIRNLYEDSQKNLWFIGGAALYKWNRRAGNFTNYDVPPYDNSSGYARGYAIMEDSNGYLWFDNERGLGRINVKTNEPGPFIPVPQHDFPVSGMLEDHSGTIWIVGSYYLSKLTDISTGLCISYRYNSDPSHGGTTNMYEDKQGKIWFTSNLGLIRFDRESEKFTYYKNDPANINSLYSNNTLCICPDPADPDGKLWVGTKGGGLNLFDKRTGTCEHFMEKDGLPDNVVYSVLADKEGNLWLSTNKGLSKYTPGTNQFINYDVHDGLQSNEFNTGSFFRSKSGEMFFGGINGFNYFYPEEVANKNFAANIVFTDFKLFGNSVSTRDTSSILKRVISDTDKITLTHSQNNFSLEFAVLDYYAPAKNRFAYKLEGFNYDWIQLGTKREVTFTGLAPGEYLLKVKGTNSDGIWNKNIAALNIIITPPWWLSPWAYGIYFLLIMSFLYALRRYELNRQQWKHDLELETVEAVKYRELNKMKSRFFANISHEFRTPLTLILGPSENILTEAPSENATKQAGAIKRNANRLLALINQLLDLSKLEAGKLELKAAKSNVVSFIKGIAMSFESVAERKDIGLKVKAERDEIELYFDNEKMTKIITNLLSNAFKFTNDDGQITVSINICHSELVSESSVINSLNKQMLNQVQHDSSVEIKIRDTGVGIAEDELPKLFDRFYQIDSSQTREHEGTGIGLALTKELVELHHGTISVDSKFGEWTEFVIKLLLGRRHLKDEEIVETGITDEVILTPDKIGGKNLLEINEAVPSHFGKPNMTVNEIDPTEDRTIILVVEDNTDVREYIRDSLGNHFQIEEAVNGEQGVRKAVQIIPDLIISDIMMPKMDGNELTRILKNDEKTSHIPIILLTAKSEQESRNEGLETGADAFLTKPFDTKELQIRIKNLINIRRKLQDKYSKTDFTPAIKETGKKLSNLEEQFLCKVKEVIENHISEEEFSIEQFGKEVGMSRVQLHRKLKALSGKSASHYLRTIRLNKAKQMIVEEMGNISEIAYSVGFSSPQYFTRCFKEEFGFPPSDLNS